MYIEYSLCIYIYVYIGIYKHLYTKIRKPNPLQKQKTIKTKTEGSYYVDLNNSKGWLLLKYFSYT